MKRSISRYDDMAREMTRPYQRPTVSSLPPTTRSAAGNSSVPEDNEEMNIMSLASRNVQPSSLTKQAAFHIEDETSSVDSRRVKLVSRSVASSLASERCHDFQDPELFDDDSSSETSRQDASSHITGNHYALSKIVDYLQTRTLASYFKNPTKEDRMKSSGLANVTKSLMAASVVHLGGKYDRRADSYLRGLRLGLSFASDRHEKQLEEANTRGRGPTGVSQDLREVNRQKRKRGGRNQRRLSSSKCQERKGRRVFCMRQHKRDMCCDAMGEARGAGVQLCTLEELKQLEALNRLCRSRKRVRPRPTRRRRSATSAYWRPKNAGKGRRRGEWEREVLSSSRPRWRKRARYGPGVASMAAGSTRTRARKPKVKPPKKKGGRSKRRR